MLNLRVLDEDENEIYILVNPNNIVSVEHTSTYHSGDTSHEIYTVFLCDGRSHNLSLEMYVSQFSDKI